MSRGRDAAIGVSSDDDPSESSDKHLPSPHPALSTVAETLDAVHALLCRFIHFGTAAQPVAVTLWVAETFVWEQFDTLIYLVVTSPVKRTGKTRLLDVLESLVPSPWRVVRPSEAVAFRRISRDHPTLLLDEYDTIFSDRGAQFEGIRSIFNSGNRRGTTTSRVMPRGAAFELVDFEIFGPKALAGIGPVPDTIADRGIVLRMTRRGPRDRVERLRMRDLKPLADPISAAMREHMRALDLSTEEPSMPAVLGDRASDGWEPLIAIADAAGKAWPAAGRAAAIALSADGMSADESLASLLLADTKRVFGDRGTARLSTQDLLDGLYEQEESPWADLRGRRLTPTHLARLLKPFGIGPELMRIGGKVIRGYDAGWFSDSWTRYLQASQAPLVLERPTSPSAAVTTATEWIQEAGIPSADLARAVTSETAVTAPGSPIAEWHLARSADADGTAAVRGITVDVQYPRSWEATDA